MLIVKMRERLAHERLFSVSAVLALAAAVFLGRNPVDYLGPDKIKVLWILFVMMLVNGGIESGGLLDLVGRKTISLAGSKRGISLILIAMTAAAAPFVTNDVALIVMVPLTVSVGSISGFDPVWTVIFESVAANAMSSVTPFGNPQNLFLYTHYGIAAPELAKVTAPFAFLSLSAVFASVFFTKNLRLAGVSGKSRAVAGRRRLYPIFLAAMILSVLRLANVYAVGAAVVAYVLLFDRSVFAKIDYFLLGTFVAFFVFSGSVASVPALGALRHYLTGQREVFAASALLSQVTSNVPSAIILSGFTSQWKPLLLGVSVGGFGTMISSLANLIAFSMYRKRFSGKYLGRFHLYSLALFGAMLFLFSAF